MTIDYILTAEGVFFNFDLIDKRLKEFHDSLLILDVPEGVANSKAGEQQLITRNKIIILKSHQ